MSWGHGITDSVAPLAVGEHQLNAVSDISIDVVSWADTVWPARLSALRCRPTGYVFARALRWPGPRQARRWAFARRVFMGWWRAAIGRASQRARRHASRITATFMSSPIRCRLQRAAGDFITRTMQAIGGTPVRRPS